MACYILEANLFISTGKFHYDPAPNPQGETTSPNVQPLEPHHKHVSVSAPPRVPALVTLDHPLFSAVRICKATAFATFLDRYCDIFNPLANLYAEEPVQQTTASNHHISDCQILMVNKSSTFYLCLGHRHAIHRPQLLKSAKKSPFQPLFGDYFQDSMN